MMKSWFLVHSKKINVRKPFRDDLLQNQNQIVQYREIWVTGFDVLGNVQVFSLYTVHYR